MPITALYGSLLCLLTIVLGVRVSLARIQRADTEILRGRVRIHGNLVENAPLFVVLLAVAEASGGLPVALHALGTCFVAARLSHAAGLSLTSGPSPLRFMGITVSWTASSAVAVYACWVAWA